jgi:MoxR-like ATPase
VVPLLCLVGASNELPESEELDALYDRFLIRRHVAQVSASNLSRLADLASGQAAPAGAAGEPVSDDAAAAAAAAAALGGAPVAQLTMADFQAAAADAHAAVRVPPAVVDLLVNLRTYLQDKCEVGGGGGACGGGSRARAVTALDRHPNPNPNPLRPSSPPRPSPLSTCPTGGS